jgi:hypothetical protein
MKAKMETDLESRGVGEHKRRRTGGDRMTDAGHGEARQENLEKGRSTVSLDLGPEINNRKGKCL